jgi:hypothetical protein
VFGEIRKTRIVKAIQHFFIKMNNEQKIHIVTYNANARLLVGGTTIHSLLSLSINKHAIFNISNSIVDIWPTIDLKLWMKFQWLVATCSL